MADEREAERNNITDQIKHLVPDKFIQEAQADSFTTPSLDSTMVLSKVPPFQSPLDQQFRPRGKPNVRACAISCSNAGRSRCKVWDWVWIKGDRNGWNT